MFILSKDVDHLEPDEYGVKVSEYKKYLSSIKDKLSLHPKGFIFEDWYRNSGSHKCPHDSWLDRIVISEDDNNEVQIELRLLGAYHDGFIVFRYSGVAYYKLDRHPVSVVKSSHGDLIKLFGVRSCLLLFGQKARPVPINMLFGQKERPDPINTMKFLLEGGVV